MRAWIGIDVSKDSLDVCLLPAEGKSRTGVFANHADGFAKLLHWVQRYGPDATLHFCMESTGAYSTGIALYLAEADQKVSVINPFRIKHFGMAQGKCNKTDKADARTIADFCRKEEPAPWRMAAPEVRLLLALLRRLQSLQGQLQQEENRLSEPSLAPAVQTSLQRTIRFLQKEMARVRQQIDEHVEKHPQLQKDKELLVSIPGIADITALWILAELPDVDQFPSAQAAAAYAGLNPCEYRSGTSIHRRTRLSKQGNAHLRRALFMPALSAKQHNPLLRLFYERLIQRGMTRKAATCAVMRKLLMLAYGVLKNGCAFDPNHAVTAA